METLLSTPKIVPTLVDSSVRMAPLSFCTGVWALGRRCKSVPAIPVWRRQWFEIQLGIRRGGCRRENFGGFLGWNAHQERICACQRRAGGTSAPATPITPGWRCRWCVTLEANTSRERWAAYPSCARRLSGFSVGQSEMPSPAESGWWPPLASSPDRRERD